MKFSTILHFLKKLISNFKNNDNIAKLTGVAQPKIHLFVPKEVTTYCVLLFNTRKTLSHPIPNQTTYL